jgi:hypothetical protein
LMRKLLTNTSGIPDMDRFIPFTWAYTHWAASGLGPNGTLLGWTSLIEYK